MSPQNYPLAMKGWAASAANVASEDPSVGWFRKAKPEPPAKPPWADEAWQAAEDLYRTENSRWFNTSDLLQVYSCLAGYGQGKRPDPRAKSLAAKHLAELERQARNIEAEAVEALPEEWERAKAALQRAREVFDRAIR